MDQRIEHATAAPEPHLRRSQQLGSTDPSERMEGLLHEAFERAGAAGRVPRATVTAIIECQREITRQEIARMKASGQLPL